MSVVSEVVADPANRGSRRRESLGAVRRIPTSAWIVLALLVAVFDATSGDRSTFYLFVFNSAMLACIGALALNLLMGTAGQVSIGNAAFMGVGGFGTVLAHRSGIAFPFDIFVAVVFAGIAGLAVGLPAARIRGLYLALATLAAHFIVLFVAHEYQSDNAPGGFFLPVVFQSKGYEGSLRWGSWLLFGVVTVAILLTTVLTHGKTGRALRMIRDHESAAPALGIPVSTYRLAIFVLSSMMIGFQGGLAAHMSGAVSTDHYTFAIAVSYIVMILIGGLDTIIGSVLGAFIIVFLPQYLPEAVGNLLGDASISQRQPQIALIAYGVLIILFITSSQSGIVGFVKGVASRRRARSRRA